MTVHIISEEEIKQGSDEWLRMRSHFITGTDAIKIINGEDIDYILATKKPDGNFQNYYTMRGHILEDESKQLYEDINDVKINNAGFITNDKYPLAGYSPDGLIGDDGLIECKSFMEKHHNSAIEQLDDCIIAQVQFGLFVSERKWAKVLLYNPDLNDLEKVFVVKDIKPDKVMQKFFQKTLQTS